MNKKQKSVIAVYAIIFVVFNILYYCIPFPKLPSVWIAYVFSLISIILGYFITVYAFKNTTELRSKVYGFPIFRIGYLYLFAQIVLSCIVFLISCFVYIPLWLSVILSVLLLGAALIGVIAADNTRDVIEELETKSEIKTKKITYFNLDIAGLVSSCKDPEIKQKLEKLSEKFKYSDPVSSEELAETEAKIEKEIKVLSELLISGNTKSVISQIDLITGMLENRNRMCKALKK